MAAAGLSILTFIRGREKFTMKYGITRNIKGGDDMVQYIYGMRLRGFSPGCQPMDGFVERTDDVRGKYYDILIYNRPLTEKEQQQYDLDYLVKAVEK